VLGEERGSQGLDRCAGQRMGMSSKERSNLDKNHTFLRKVSNGNDAESGGRCESQELRIFVNKRKKGQKLKNI